MAPARRCSPRWRRSTRSPARVSRARSPDGYREFLGGLKDGGEVTIEANFLPAHASQNASTGVISFFDAGERRNYQIVWPTSPTTSWQFAAVVQSVEPAAPVDDKLNLSVTFKLSGKPAFL
jgi:hypothetical protein